MKFGRPAATQRPLARMGICKCRQWGFGVDVGHCRLLGAGGQDQVRVRGGRRRSWQHGGLGCGRVPDITFPTSHDGIGALVGRRREGTAPCEDSARVWNHRPKGVASPGDGSREGHGLTRGEGGLGWRNRHNLVLGPNSVSASPVRGTGEYPAKEGNWCQKGDDSSHASLSRNAKARRGRLFERVDFLGRTYSARSAPLPPLGR